MKSNLQPGSMAQHLEEIICQHGRPSSFDIMRDMNFVK